MGVPSKTRRRVKGPRVHAGSTFRPTVVRSATRAAQKAFLSAYSRVGNVSAACDAARIDQRTHYRWKELDENYQKAFAMAEENFADTLEHEAIRRARDGAPDYVTFKGKIVMVPEDPMKPNSRKVPLIKKNFSDQLMILLLKAARPEKYRDKVDVTSAGKAVDYKVLKGVSPDDL